MSIASAFRDKMDAALLSADQTRGNGPDSRRASLQRDLDAAGYMLLEKEMVAALMDKAREANAESRLRHTPDREAIARAAFRVLHPHESWNDFDSRKAMRGGCHPMQIQAFEVADALIAMIEGD